MIAFTLPLASLSLNRVRTRSRLPLEILIAESNRPLYLCSWFWYNADRANRRTELSTRVRENKSARKTSKKNSGVVDGRGERNFIVEGEVSRGMASRRDSLGQRALAGLPRTVQNDHRTVVERREDRALQVPPEHG